MTRQAIQKKRAAHLILGLKVANRFVYPKWQFDRYGQVLPGLAAILKHLFSSEQNSLEVVARLNEPITHKTACALEKVLRVPAHFWLNMETSYRERLLREGQFL